MIPVQVRDLTIRLRRQSEKIHAVNGVSFDLAAGEVLGVIGESGAGKSMMLRNLLGMLPAAAEVGGTVRIFGRDLATMPEHELAALRGRTVSMVFQEPSTAIPAPTRCPFLPRPCCAWAIRIPSPSAIAAVSQPRMRHRSSAHFGKCGARACRWSGCRCAISICRTAAPAARRGCAA
jgi:ABC-type oligopeptide transport system ATPase subunit